MRLETILHEVSTDKKDMTIVKSDQLVGLIGKTAFTSLLNNPFFKQVAQYEHAWKHGVNSVGFHIVEVYPYYSSVHTTEDGRIRPTMMVQFTISHFGGKGRVVQARKFMRSAEPDEQEKRYGPSAGWKPGISWKKDE